MKLNKHKKDEYQIICNIVDNLNGYTVIEGISILATVIWMIIRNSSNDHVVRKKMCEDVARSLKGICNLKCKDTQA